MTFIESFNTDKLSLEDFAMFRDSTNLWLLIDRWDVARLSDIEDLLVAEDGWDVACLSDVEDLLLAEDLHLDVCLLQGSWR